MTSADQTLDEPRRRPMEASARSSWGAGTWLCLLVASYFAVSALFAALSFERYGAALPQFLRYILVPAAIMLTFVVIPFVLNRGKTLLVGIYAFAFLAALFLAETYLTMRGIPFILGGLGQLSEEQRHEFEQNETMIRGFTLGRINKLAEVDSLAEAKLSGFPHATTLLCTMPEGPGGDAGPAIYQADRYGFNNPDQVYDRPADLVVVGDSFIEGFCLPEGEDLVAELRKQGSNAISLGIRGSGPLVELAMLGRFGPSLRPPHVVMAFFEANDWRNLGNELSQPWLREALEPDADFGRELPSSAETERLAWELVQNLTSEPITGFDLLTRTALLRNYFALHRVGQPLGLIYPKVPKAIPEYQDVLARAKAIVESWGGEFSLLYIPEIGRFGGLLPTAFVFDQLRHQVTDAADAAGVPVIDLTPAFYGNETPKRFYAPDAHFSEEGADFVAAMIADRLR